MKFIFKILKKIFWLIIFIVVLVLAVYCAYLGVLKFEFNDSIEYTDIVYKNDTNDKCLSFTKDSYKLDDCNGKSIDVDFDSTHKCKNYYSKGYNALLFECKNFNINLLKIDEISFNKIVFQNNNRFNNLINKSVFSTKDNNEVIKFNFENESKIKFEKYKEDNTIIDDELCSYTFDNKNLELNCKDFYGTTTFKVDNYKNGELTIINNDKKIVFNIEK